MWKLPYFDKSVFKFYEDEKKQLAVSRYSKPIYTGRNGLITELALDHYVQIHGGKHFVSLCISEEHLGLKFGALALTKSMGMFMHLSNKVNRKKKEQLRMLKQKKKQRKSKKVRLKLKLAQKLKRLRALKAKKKKEL